MTGMYNNYRNVLCQLGSSLPKVNVTYKKDRFSKIYTELNIPLAAKVFLYYKQHPITDRELSLYCDNINT